MQLKIYFALFPILDNFKLIFYVIWLKYFSLKVSMDNFLFFICCIIQTSLKTGGLDRFTGMVSKQRQTCLYGQ